MGIVQSEYPVADKRIQPTDKLEHGEVAVERAKNGSDDYHEPLGKSLDTAGNSELEVM